MNSDSRNEISIDSREYAHMMLMEGITIWEHEMYSHLKGLAIQSWGDDWFSKCISCLGKNMQKNSKPDRCFDCFRIIVMNKLFLFRSLRDKLSHLDKSLSPMECLTGIRSARDILRYYSEKYPPRIDQLVAELRSVVGDGDEGMPRILSIDPGKPKILFSLIAHAILRSIVESIGTKICFHLQKCVNPPALPVDLSEVRSIILKRKEKNPDLCKTWEAYRLCDLTEMIGCLDEIKILRNMVCHEIDNFGEKDAKSLTNTWLHLANMLRLDVARIQEIHDCLENITRSGGDGMHADSVLVQIKVKWEKSEKLLRVMALDKVLVGRDQLVEDIANELCAAVDQGKPCRLALTGPSGVGKTAVARRVCEVVLKKFPLQLLVQGSSASALRSELALLGRDLVANVGPEANEKEVAEELLLMVLHSQDWLLVIDDAEPSALEEVLGPVEMLSGFLLFTSQVPQDRLLHLTRSAWCIDVLSSEESMELLSREETGRKDSPVKKDIVNDRVADLRGYMQDYLGNLPIAVAMLRGALSNVKTVEDARVLMKSLRERGFERRLGEGQGDWYVKSLPAVVEQLLVQLDYCCSQDKELVMATRRLLAMLCMLDPAGSPNEFFIGTLNGEMPLFDSSLFERARHVLLNLRLVDQGRGSDWTGMHAIHQRCIAEHLTCGRHVSFVEWGLLLKALSNQFSGPARFQGKLASKLYGSACVFISRVDNDGDVFSFLNLESPLFLKLLEGTGLAARDVKFDWERGKRYLERAVNVSEILTGPQSLATASTTNHLAKLLHAMGKYSDALKAYDKALQIRMTTGGLSHLDTANSLNEIGLLHRDTGQQDLALSHLERAHGIYENVLGPEHSETVVTLNNSALIHTTMGRYDDALRLFLHALKVIEGAQDPEHAKIATSLNNVAGAYVAMGQYDLAVNLYERARSIRVDVLGPEHPCTATSQNNLAQVYHKMGRYDEALHHFETAIAINQKLLGPEHPHVLTFESNLASLLADMGRYKEAEELNEKVLRIRTSILGDDHPDLAISLNNLAVLHQYHGCHIKKALPYFESALKIRGEVENPETASILNNIAMNLRANGQYGDALEIQERAHRILEKFHCTKHRDTACALSNLALLHADMREYQRALHYLSQALDIYETVDSPEHPSTATCLMNIACVYRLIGQHDAAQPMVERAHGIREKLLGQGHPFTAKSLNALAALYFETGKLDKASSLYRKALDIQENMHENYDADKCITLHNLARLLEAQGLFEDALKNDLESLEIRKNVHGSRHPETAVSLHCIGLLYDAMGQHEEAVSQLEEAISIRSQVFGLDHPDTVDTRDCLARIIAGH